MTKRLVPHKPGKRAVTTGPQPWDPLPISAEGDVDPMRIHTAVGVALSTWEGVELSFATVMMRVFRHGAALRVYGAIVGSGRFEMIRAASESHFGPDSDEHNQLTRLVDTASKYSTRRAEIAHGRVSRIADPSIPAVGYYLLPSMISKKSSVVGLRPKYAYTSRDIMEFDRRFAAFGSQFDRAVGALFQHQKRR